ncbi:AAA family ATPase [Helicobacter felis]|uniref:AAA family ATPase n=1 Tax=Helicobacter felis TaxID=214 RepID=UPI000CEE5077|nr:AAA family ATPase [Helicobacter felis]
MINFIQIENFKSIQKEIFELRPLTCFTGTNSVGKSSVLQTILLASCYNHNNMWLRDAIYFVMSYTRYQK